MVTLFLTGETYNMKEAHQVKETLYMKETYVLVRYQDLCALDGDALSHT